MAHTNGGYFARRVVVPGFRTATLISLPHREIVEKLKIKEVANGDEPEKNLLEYPDDPSKPAMERVQRKRS